MNVFRPMSSNWVDENMNNEPNVEVKKFFDLWEAAKKSLYEGCELSLLSAVSRLINIKCEFSLPNKATDNVLALMEEMSPPDIEIVGTYYFAKNVAY